MRRYLVLIVVVMACKKTKQVEDAPEPPKPPSTGHSVTKVKGGSAEEGSGSEVAAATEDAGSAEEAPPAQPKPGGDGSPATRAADGRIHGPGGPVYMGGGMSCDAAHDHCLRDGVWFSVDNFISGKLYRAVPVFEFENKLYNWRGDEQEHSGKLYKTRLADPKAPPSRGTPIIWFSAETSTAKWTDSEYDALTSSRWEGGIVDTSNAGQVTVKGWPDSIPIDTVRVITQVK